MVIIKILVHFNNWLLGLQNKFLYINIVIIIIIITVKVI